MRAFLEILCQQNAAVSRGDLRCCGVVARAHGDDALGDHFFHRAAGILRRRAQHSQVDLDRFGHGPAVVDLDRDHVAFVPGEHPRMHAGCSHVEQSLVHRQALARAVSGNLGTRARELEIAKPRLPCIVLLSKNDPVLCGLDVDLG